MNNTFWTLIEENYYRIHNGILKQAPANELDFTINRDNEIKVEVITSEMLEKINTKFGSCFTIDDFQA